MIGAAMTESEAHSPEQESLLNGKWRQPDIKQDSEHHGTIGSSDNVSNNGTAGVWSSVFNLSTTVVGAGIMALPATVRVLGLPLSVLLMLAMGFISEVCVEIIVRFVSSKVNVKAYEEMVAVECRQAPRLARIGTQVIIVVFTLGILICYLIIIADVIAGSAGHLGLLEQWIGRYGWWNNRPIIILLTILLVLSPLAALPSMDSLKYSSAVSIGLALLFVVLTVGVALVKLAMGDVEKPRLLPDISSASAWYDIFSVIPIMTNAFVCHFNVPPIYHELRGKTRRKMNTVVRFSVTFCTVLYILTGVSGYLLFGEATAADILSNFDTNLLIPYSDLINYIIRVGYAVHIMLVFPVIFFSTRLTVYALIFPNSGPLAEHKTRSLLLTVALLSITYIGSTVIPDIWIAFNFTGATTGMCIAFIFPTLAAICSNSTDPGDNYQRTVAWVTLPVAALSSIVGVVTQVQSLV